MKTLIHKYPWLSLLFVALLCGLLWRLEVEYYGWAGLRWLHYFHDAIPAGFMLVLLWTNFFVVLPPFKRVLLNLAAVLYGVILHLCFHDTLVHTFAMGPAGFVLWMQTPEWQKQAFRVLFLLLPATIPFGVYVLLRLFKQPTSLPKAVLAVLAFYLSIPFSIALLELTAHKGTHDLIHTLKSGLLIPCWVMSIGILFVHKRVPAEPAEFR